MAYKLYTLYTLDNKPIKGVLPDNFTGIVKYPTGGKYWYLNGEYHRLNGPAAELWNGEKEWYINGKQISEEQHKLYVDLLKLKGLS